MRGRSLMLLGQGISQAGADIGNIMLKSNESKYKRAESEKAVEKYQSDIDYNTARGLKLKSEVDANRIALAKAEEEDRVLAGLFEAVSMLPKSKRIQNEFATLIDKGLQASQEPKTQYQTPAGTWEGEDTEAPQTPEEKPLSRNEQYERILKEYPQAIGIKNPGVQQYLSYLREPEEAPGETPEQKMQREKDLITWRAEETKRTRPPKGTSPETDPKTFQQEATLRKEYNALAKDYSTVRDSYLRVTESAKEPSAAGDLSMIFNYMKMLDPKSVVRESEYASAENARGVPETIRNTYNKVLKGEILSKGQRADFIKRAESIYSTTEKTQLELKTQYRKTALDYGIDPDRVTGSIVIRGGEETAPGTEEEELEYDPATGTFKKVRR